ncbi:hypothetical protein LOZ53_000614 [Ophidiomyces ophidiicola]|nr:hypothetical protein LOZ55_001300 [Ophidiomyces ophidiicola]KAI1987600.1 hypothetical protein LOZ54_003496 [Ophidiomyces ophidiicola]KAI1997434.1 hypothetical protein LOZ53_000614 [Ophidiomyces ophidiicola]KAI1999453.1 hypothetical protein LOZ51_001940 [Ophidiomyces ophidiicola]
MKFFTSSTVLSFVFFFSYGLAVPVADAEPQPVPNPGPGPVPASEPGNNLMSRDPANILSSLVPALNAPSNCPTQTNQCSSGTPFCCSTDSGSHNCVKSTVNCQQKVICCNNNFGFQMCIGDIDFNMPITININLNKGRGLTESPSE